MSRPTIKDRATKRTARPLSPPMLALILGLGAITTTALLSARIAEKIYDGKAIDMRLSNHPSLVVVQELKHEQIFRNTIKSCLPSENSKCKTFIPTVNGTEKQRIAIISSPGVASRSVYNQIVPIQSQYNHKGNQAVPAVNAFLRTSVPPYGYGKTHGLTRIIRLVPQPLALEITDALRSLLEPGESHTVIALSDLKAALRQILRFHCRLSAVAAHTALLSINYQEMTTDMANVVKKIDTFLGANDPTLGIGKRGGKVLESDQGGLFDAPQSFGAQLFTRLQDETKIKVHEILDQVLLEELTLSKNLTIWPCPSFWSAGDEPHPFELSPLVQRLARALSPDCNDPLAQCWVDRDICESKGDGLCKGPK